MQAPDLHPDLDPELAALVPDLDAEVVAMLRETGLTAPVELSDRVIRTDHVVSVDPHVVVRVHRPVGFEGLLPALYSIHGGGYVIGSHDMDDPVFDRLCPDLGIVGVSVEYRLAPEHPYPAAIDDCEAGLRWLFEHAGDIGADANRIGITGVSAGGGLCAALGLRARDAGLPVRFQLLDCPMIDDRRRTVSSQLEGWPSGHGRRTRTAGSPTSATSRTARFPPTLLRPAPRISRACRRAMCVSAAATASVTRTSPSPSG